MIGRKIGVQATGQILLAALLRKNGIPDNQVEKVIIGSDMTPLMTGQVDAVTGWITNTTALKVLWNGFRLAPMGLRRPALRAALLRDERHADPKGGSPRRFPAERRAAAGLTPRPTPRRRWIF